MLSASAADLQTSAAIFKLKQVHLAIVTINMFGKFLDKKFYVFKFLPQASRLGRVKMAQIFISFSAFCNRLFLCGSFHFNSLCFFAAFIHCSECCFGEQLWCMCLGLAMLYNELGIITDKICTANKIAFWHCSFWLCFSTVPCTPMLLQCVLSLCVAKCYCVTSMCTGWCFCFRALRRRRENKFIWEETRDGSWGQDPTV